MNKYLESNKERFLNELFELIKIPSISAVKEYDNETRKAAIFLKDQFESLGFSECEICETKGHPIVYAEKIIDEKLPTVLVYGHYDVQPVDPIELWDSDPFNPVVKKTEIHPEGAIFARGACDDKGQMFMHIKAIEVLKNTSGIPCNIKLMIEGEEEIGSDNLEIFVKENKEKLKCDIIIVSDTGMIDKNTPSITTGLRGLAYLEVELTGPDRDLHSGHYGGSVSNPLNELAKMIASLHNENNRVTIPNFYDNVIEFSDEEREKDRLIPFDIEEFKKSIDIGDVKGEKGYNTLERRSIRPCLDVNGMWGGYTDEGSKTVIPSKAYAKISMRLVSNQNWKEISDLFSEHMKKITPSGMKIKITEHHGGEPYLTSTKSKAYKAASDAYKDVFGKEPFALKDGGSIPIIAQFEKELGVKTILMGFGLDSDAIHSPNEHFGVSNFYNGIETITNFYKYYSK
ncbi:MAG: dipeptidase [Bacteroidota bacterium]|nr:dipeptidase [Bacteroidota bacterium]MEE2605368.1 dipeptidase [Bacteroidota bacterium]